jgi:hypothetical protein
MKPTALCWGALLAMSASANAMTYSEWNNSSQELRAGYVWGIAESLFTFASDEEGATRARAYHKCFVENQINSDTALSIVNAHLFRTPDAATKARQSRDPPGDAMAGMADMAKTKKAFEAAAKEAKVWVHYRGP